MGPHPRLPTFLGDRPPYRIVAAGEAAGEAAAMAIRRGRGSVNGINASTDVRSLDVSKLQARLRAHGSDLVVPS